jgi:hypothetical protein
MGKELEALELIDSYINLDEYDGETSGVAEAIRLIKRTLQIIDIFKEEHLAIHQKGIELGWWE